LERGGDIQPRAVAAGDSIHHRPPEIFVGINPAGNRARAAQFYF
jgi:hypothetical protein